MFAWSRPGARRIRRRRCGLHTCGMADRLKVEIVAVDPPGVLDLAETTGLTAYDTSYLWVARSIGAELVTLDRKLAAAVR